MIDLGKAVDALFWTVGLVTCWLIAATTLWVVAGYLADAVLGTGNLHSVNERGDP